MEKQRGTAMPGAPALGVRVSLAELVERLGAHPSTALALDLERAPDRPRWLVAARILAERAPEPAALEGFRRLDAVLGAAPGALRRAAPERIAEILEGAGLRRAQGLARGLWRAADALCGPGGDLETRAAESLDLGDLGGRVAALAPGFGTATVLRFLRPLRDTWSAAREVPLSEAARAAAVHLGLLAEGEDAEGEPALLRRACAELAPDLRWIDVEAALERLGARACRAARGARCPLGAACPLRAAADGPAEAALPGLGPLD